MKKLLLLALLVASAGSVFAQKVSPDSNSVLNNLGRSHGNPHQMVAL